MRVAIDARGIQPRLQGVGRHVLNLLLGLSFKESDLEFLVFYNDPVALRMIERSGGPYRGRFQWIKARAFPGSWLERIEIPWLLRMNHAALVHDIGTTGLWTGNLPSIVTAHELSSLEMKRGLKRARLIIAVSQSLAQEIETDLSISRPKIRVISSAIDPWYTERVSEKEIKAMRDRFKLAGRYFLCVTADRPRKNVALVKALAQSWIGQENWVFTMAGESTGSIRYLDVVEDAWLRPLYAAASAVIVPSSYEGFSLPPLEALAVETLPVVSDIPPHQETLGEVLPQELFFDPRDAKSLEKALRRVLDGGDTLKASVLEKFRLVRDRYSFVEKAEQVQLVYREILRG